MELAVVPPGLSQALLELQELGKRLRSPARLPRSNSLSISFSTSPAGEAAAPSAFPRGQAGLAAEQSRPFLPRTDPNNLCPTPAALAGRGMRIPAALPSPPRPPLPLLRGGETRREERRGGGEVSSPGSHGLTPAGMGGSSPGDAAPGPAPAPGPSRAERGAGGAGGAQALSAQPRREERDGFHPQEPLGEGKNPSLSAALPRAGTPGERQGCSDRDVGQGCWSGNVRSGIFCQRCSVRNVGQGCSVRDARPRMLGPGCSSRDIGQECSIRVALPGMPGQESSARDAQRGTLGQECSVRDAQPGIVGQGCSARDARSGMLGRGCSARSWSSSTLWAPRSALSPPVHSCWHGRGSRGSRVSV